MSVELILDEDDDDNGKLPLELGATDARIDTDLEGHVMRLVLLGKKGVPKAYLILTSLQGYDVAESLLRAFDKIEGIK